MRIGPPVIAFKTLMAFLHKCHECQIDGPEDCEVGMEALRLG